MSETCKLKFESPRSQSIPPKSGINWGKADAHVSEEDAYIPIRQNDLDEHPSLFPIVGTNQEIMAVTWDDGTKMICCFEGTQDYKGNKYPKQISSLNDKSELGSYLRRRMNVSPQVTISDSDFINYGRKDIDITKKDDGTYYFDFSV